MDLLKKYFSRSILIYYRKSNLTKVSIESALPLLLFFPFPFSFFPHITQGTHSVFFRKTCRNQAHSQIIHYFM